MQSVLAGDTQLSFATPPSVLPLVQAGRLRALAVTSRDAHAAGARRAGHGRGRAARLRDLVLVRLLRAGGHAGRGDARACSTRPRRRCRLPEVERALAKEGTETSGSASPADFAAFLAEDAKLWARLVKDSGAKAD